MADDRECYDVKIYDKCGLDISVTARIARDLGRRSIYNLGKAAARPRRPYLWSVHILCSTKGVTDARTCLNEDAEG